MLKFSGAVRIRFSSVGLLERIVVKRMFLISNDTSCLFEHIDVSIIMG